MVGTGAATDEVGLGLIQLLMRFFGEVLPPLGAALIGAGIVLIHLELRHQELDNN